MWWLCERRAKDPHVLTVCGRGVISTECGFHLGGREVERLALLCDGEYGWKKCR